jgi:hypothetical protein
VVTDGIRTVARRHPMFAIDNPPTDRAEELPLPWLLVPVASAWLFALVLFLSA